MGSARNSLRERLRWYAPMELANAGLVPAIMVIWCLAEDQSVGWLLAVTALPMCALLLVGGRYWQLKLAQLDGKRPDMTRFLRFAIRIEPFLIALCAAALVNAAASWLVPGWSLSLGERIAASIAAVLAVLEYVNYYHRQLQHFDHWPDFKRLISGQGLRQAQMANDIARLKSQSGKASL